MAGPPDFIGVGAQACGVEWWWSLLAAHPEIQAPPRCDLHFFDEFCSREMLDADVARYHAHFKSSVSGEWTPRYMYDPWTPRLLYRAAPEARLLALVRDPIERFRAGMALARVNTPDRVPHLAVTDAIERSRYALQLRRLLELYERDRLLVLQYEKCRSDPAGEYARTLRFLGVADSFQPQELAVAEPEDELAPAPWPDLEADLRRVLEPEVRALRSMVPDLDLALWPSFSSRAAHAATVSVPSSSEIDTSIE